MDCCFTLLYIQWLSGYFFANGHGKFLMFKMSTTSMHGELDNFLHNTIDNEKL
jgi:hypothetical protein